MSMQIVLNATGSGTPTVLCNVSSLAQATAVVRTLNTCWAALAKLPHADFMAVCAALPNNVLTDWDGYETYLHTDGTPTHIYNRGFKAI